MLIRDRFDSSKRPFVGDREIVLGRLPAGSRLRAARARVVPDSNNSFTATRAPAAGQLRMTVREFGSAAEVDLPARLTLVALSGRYLAGARLQVDVGGGVFSEINEFGVLSAPDDRPFKLSKEDDIKEDDIFPLPGMRVARFRVWSAEGSPRVDSVTVRSVPSGLRLSVDQEVLWNLPGEITDEVEIPNFAALLAPAIEAAEVENGFVVLPLVLHTEAFARFALHFEFDIGIGVSPLPRGLDSARLRFDHGGLPLREDPFLRLAMPAQAKILATSGRMRGGFGASRIVYESMQPSGASQLQEIRPGTSLAQPFVLPRPAAADAVDLLLAAADRETHLRVDLVNDLDGKPGSSSLLGKSLEIRLGRARAGEPTWISTPLTAALEIGTERQWLVIESLEGTAVWSAQEQATAEAEAEAEADEPHLQITRNGALSWRLSASPESSGPLTGLFRLRRDESLFTMPVAFQVGEGEAARRVGLERFEASERVDFELDLPELVEAIDQHLAAIPVCPQAEHLKNGDFARWSPSAPQTSATGEFKSSPDSWTVTRGSARPHDGGGLQLGYQKETGPHGLSQVTAVSGGCTYELSFRGGATAAGSIAELFWLDENGSPLREVAVPFEVVMYLGTDFLHRLRETAPAAARQAELRFIVEEADAALTEVSLRATSELLVDPDFTLAAQNSFDPANFRGWRVSESAKLSIDGKQDKTVKLSNTGDEALILTQEVTFTTAESTTSESTTAESTTAESTTAQASYLFEIEGHAPAAPTELRLSWLGDDGTALGEAVVLTVGDQGNAAFDTVPEAASQALVTLELSPGSELEIESLSLRLVPRTEVPLTLISQAPGELELRDFEVTWELRQPVLPPSPAAGLAPPTPPGSKPGEPCDEQPEEAVGMHRSSPPRDRTPSLVPREELPPLTAITGIAQRRTEQLAELGITSMAELAAADPAVIEKLPLVTPLLARRFVDRAQELLDEVALRRR